MILFSIYLWFWELCDFVLTLYKQIVKTEIVPEKLVSKEVLTFLKTFHLWKKIVEHQKLKVAKKIYWVWYTRASIWNFVVCIVLLLWRWKIKYGAPSNHLFQRWQEHGKTLRVKINLYKKQCLTVITWNKKHRRKLYQ